jgi:hypothetical protein
MPKALADVARRSAAGSVAFVAAARLPVLCLLLCFLDIAAAAEEEEAKQPLWAESYPTCSCACCITQARGDGVRWGRTEEESDTSCAPIYYSQQFIHEGFATCEKVIGHSGTFCEVQKEDVVLASARSGQVDMTRFCFYACMPSGTGNQIGGGGECIPVTAEALKALGMHKNYNVGESAGQEQNNLGGGADLGNVAPGAAAGFTQYRRLSLHRGPKTRVDHQNRSKPQA